MPTLIIGANGSMGQRYQAILRHLDEPFVGMDKESCINMTRDLAPYIERFIVATPTETHLKIVESLLEFGKPILCEKPICKNMGEIDRLFPKIEASKAPFRMMYQYEMLVDPDKEGLSSYNYFKHGGDGLKWDCLQILGLAKGKVTLSDLSPIWKCMINGKSLNLTYMDAAYIGYIRKWLSNPSQNLEKLYDIHAKVEAFSA